MYKKQKDGYYCTTVRMSDGTKKYLRARSQAKLKEKILAAKKEDQEGVYDTNMLVQDWVEVWFENYKQGCRLNTRRMYRNCCDKQILPVIGELKVNAVKPIHVQKILNNVADQSESSQKKVLLTCTQIFEAAKNNLLILRNPCDGLNIASHKPPDKKKALTVHEQKELRTAMMAADDQEAAAFALLCLDCGLRKEEAFGLKWSDIKGETLTVNRAVVYAAGKLDSTLQLKNKASHRTVPLPPATQYVLASLDREKEFIFGSDTALGVPSERKIRRLAKALSPYHPHQLRHTYCTNLARAGVDIRTASRLMGHASIAMTANVYTNLEEEDIQNSAERIIQFIGKM